MFLISYQDLYTSVYICYSPLIILFKLKTPNPEATSNPSCAGYALTEPATTSKNLL